MGASETTAMRRVRETRECNAGCICLFRIGDFWEAFYDDARIVAQVLGLVLTANDKAENSIPMTGFPQHQTDSYLRKLIAAGHRVALCEEVGR